jgi:carbonic anhydrase
MATKIKNQESQRLTSVFDDPPRNNVLLLTCMDQRLLDDTVRFMNAMNLHNRYDQVALAGGAMGVFQLPNRKLPEGKRWQGVFQAHLAAAINDLARPIKDVFLLDHLDCGAYKYLHPDDKVKTRYKDASLCEMIPLHKKELSSLAGELKEFIAYQRQSAEKDFNAAHDACETHGADIQQNDEKSCWDYVCELAWKKVEAWSGIRVSYFVMDLLGNVRQLDVPEGESATLSEKLNKIE